MMAALTDYTQNLMDPGLQPDELVMRAEEGEFDPPAPDDILALQKIPRDALAVLLRVVLPSSRYPDTPGFWRTATLRLAALAIYVDPEVRALSQSAVARAANYTRSALNVEVIRLRDAFNLDHRGGCCDKARQTFAESQRQSWKRRKSLQPTADSIG